LAIQWLTAQIQTAVMKPAEIANWLTGVRLS
jgi:hypothetical protein